MQSKAMQSKATQCNAKQCKPKHSKAKQCKAKQCKAKQIIAKQSNVNHSNAKQNKKISRGTQPGRVPWGFLGNPENLRNPRGPLRNPQGHLKESVRKCANNYRVTSSHVLHTRIREHACFGPKLANDCRMTHVSPRIPRGFLGKPGSARHRHKPPILWAHSKNPL